jgi:integrase
MAAQISTFRRVIRTGGCMRVKLNQSAVKNIAPPATGYALCWDRELCGFGLRVTAAGVRSFVVEKRIRGRTRRLTLGRWPAVTCAAARKRAQAHLGQVAAGKDPFAERARAKEASITVEEAFREYVDFKRRRRSGRPLKERTQADMLAIMSRELGDWKSRRLASITRPMIEQAYRKICERSVAQANLAMRYLHAVFNFSIERTVDADGRPLLLDNPVKVLRHQWRTLAPRKGVMTAEQLLKWVPAVQMLGEVPRREQGAGKQMPKLRHGEVCRDLLIFLALTGCRLNEARCLTVPDIDLKTGEVTFRETKNGTDHILPLTPYLRRLLECRLAAGKSKWVFSSPHDGRLVGNYRGAVKRVRHAAGIYFIPHDLRRLAATAMERGGVPVYTIKAVLNHATGRDVTAQYVQVAGDMKLAAMQKIEQFVLGQGGMHCAPSNGPRIDQPAVFAFESMSVRPKHAEAGIAYTLQTRLIGSEGGFSLQNLPPQDAVNAYTVPTPWGGTGRGRF